MLQNIMAVLNPQTVLGLWLIVAASLTLVEFFKGGFVKLTWAWMFRSGEHSMMVEGGFLWNLIKITFLPVTWTYRAIRWILANTVSKAWSARKARQERLAVEREKARVKAEELASKKARQDDAMANMGINVGRLADSVESIDQRTGRMEQRMDRMDTDANSSENEALAAAAAQVVEKALSEMNAEELVAYISDKGVTLASGNAPKTSGRSAAQLRRVIEAYQAR